MRFAVHPNVYSTDPRRTGLRTLLENVWGAQSLGNGSFYIFSGFANYNGGARFYKTFTEHVDAGGSVVAFLGGSTSQRLSSVEVAEALLTCGAQVSVVNRKRQLHTKLYGWSGNSGQQLVVSSGNFTGPGMSQNVEATIALGCDEVAQMGFSWSRLEASFRQQAWQMYDLSMHDRTAPGWGLLYDERVGAEIVDEAELATLIIVLGHSDTVRIQAAPGTTAARGSQYFWLSTDCFDFFPPLTIRNQRGYKGTLSTFVTLSFPEMNIPEARVRVTFEAQNNLDVRLGTGPLRNTRLATAGDIAGITRVADDRYELRVIGQQDPRFPGLCAYATTFVGQRRKQYGFIENERIFQLI